MVENESNWRLLKYDTFDPKVSLAVSEAIFRCKRAGLSSNTLYFWQTNKPIIIFYAGSKHEISKKSENQKIELLRSCGVAGNNYFCDTGNINFSIIINSKFLLPFIKGEYQPLLSEYRFILSFFAKVIKGFGIDVEEDPYGIYTVQKKEIVSAQPSWIKDTLLFQGTIYLNTNLETLREGLNREVTSIQQETKISITPQEICKMVEKEFEEKMDISFKKEGLIDVERKLSEKLFNEKYGKERWHVEGKAPFLALLGETLMVLYIANPPTSKCRKLIENVKKVIDKIKGEIKVIVWRRGAGAEQHPLELMPPVIITLSKAHILPAVIINGEVKFALEVPSEEKLQEAILYPDRFPDILGSLLKVRSQVS